MTGRRQCALGGAAPVLLASVLAIGLPAGPLAAGFGCERFRRGDANADGSVDISDAVTILLALFRGGDPLDCLEAADTDDSDQIDVTDAVALLMYLFQGGPPPAAPGPEECGSDKSFDALDCALYPPCEPAAEPRDFSDFRTFRYEVEPALGFCPEPDRVFAAEIRRTEKGSYVARLTVLELRPEPGPDCIPEFLGGECAVAVELPEKTLSPEEVERVREAFRNVGTFSESAAICFCVAIDPCVLSFFEWDGERWSDFLCASRWLEGETVERIRNVLESLR